MPGEKLLASTIAKDYQEEITSFVRSLASDGIPAPLLVGLLASDDPAAAQYAEWTRRAFLADGLRYEVRRVAPTDVESALTDLNTDPNVHGILVYYPIFGQEQSLSGSSIDDYLRDSVVPSKDVEGLCHTYRTSLYRNVRYLDGDPSLKCVLPCTALSVVKILEHAGVYDAKKTVGDRCRGRVVTVVNRSEIVGRPLAAMLANDGAKVYSVDVDSIYVFEGGRMRAVGAAETPESCVRRSHVVVTGVPSKGYNLPAGWLREGAVVVNVASFKNVKADDALKVEGVKYCGMVGKVTVKMLERNLCRLYNQYHRPGLRKREGRREAAHFAVSAYTAVVATAALALGLAVLGRRR
mmetsp:Transcript_15440/g.30789  ORF Transcript_15440/g.30789 Transcript_15440/m.30789 type:complete len:352 (+) Transcript_15440:54-1109(+)